MGGCEEKFQVGKREHGEHNISPHHCQLPAQSRTDCGQAWRVEEEKGFNSLTKAISLFSLYHCINTYTHIHLHNKKNIIYKILLYILL